ncbi:translation initiation factor IF-2 [Streptomyces sp. Ru73]|uniref:PP2C family protein-serine/threonine phosphatase n=1 Tax=Streptomyces sp. Ru73 TaxID=2080748 RepID=UPI000CDDB8BB|nr:PP2C family protein-serine/threonine phosphatase [Streptomyces sp. Ru73]POX36835.1 translation initiation factor IF-2 [Streptomyces sp. Ru73]
MTPQTFHTLPALRGAVRRLGDAHQLPIETRARLVLAISAVAQQEFQAGGYTVLETLPAPQSTGPGPLTVVLRAPLKRCMLPTSGLPLPAQVTADGAAVWHVTPGAHDGPGIPAQAPAAGDGHGNGARPAAGDGPSVPRQAEDRQAEDRQAEDRQAARPDGTRQVPVPSAEAAALEEELRAALAHLDAVTAEHQRLKHELAETNSGVLALYVQLEERDEQLRNAHGKILRELEDALRPSPITVDGLELAVHYAPAEAAAPTGGDFYDWFVLPDGTVHITVVDALGHGVRSTKSALNVTHAVRTLALEGHPLHFIVERVNEVLAPFDPELMATVLLARIEPKSGRVQLANGSHPPALVMRADGTGEYQEVRGRGIGFPAPGSEKVRETRLEAGDLLMLYTDGLTESRRDPLEGERRLIESARRHRYRPIDEIPGALAEDMHRVILHSDDTLALAVRVVAPGN